MFGQSVSERTHPNRQVWAALCQQPKINKILSARNLLKHIHLAVLGEKEAGGGRKRRKHLL